MTDDGFYRTDLHEQFPELLRPDAVLWWVEMKAATRVDWPAGWRDPQTEEDR